MSSLEVGPEGNGFLLDRIHLEVTNRCNFRCEFCPQGSLTRPPGDMDYHLFQRLVEEVARDRIAPAVTYHVLGEPLLYPKLPEAVAFTREAGLRPIVVTNGSLLTLERAEALARARPHLVAVSLQTPDPESFRLRGARAMDYARFRETILAGARELLRESPDTRVSLHLLTTPLKWALYPATRGLSILDTSRVLRRTARAWSRALAGALGPDHPLRPADEIDEAAGRLRVWRQNRLDLSERLAIETRVVGDWGRRARLEPEVRARYPARIGRCHGLLEHLAVLRDGTYTYCCADYDGATSRRNAVEMGIAEFLRMPEVRRDRDGFRSCRVNNPVCRACLGGPTRIHRAVRQFGSIFYHGVYRRWFQDPVTYRDG